VPFEMKNGLLVPKAATPPIYVFVDETYLLNETGFVQAAVPVPANLYTSQLLPICKELLSKLGKDAKEFKGSGIKAGNKEIYRSFLRLFVDVTTQVGDKADLHPIASVDASAPYKGGQFQGIFDNVTGGLKNLGIEGEDNLVAAFSQQVLWLFRHWRKISNTRYSNALVLLFDNKHRYAQRFNEQRIHVNSKLIAPAFWELGKTMTSFANTLFKQIDATLPIPRISCFDFKWSPAEFGIQAADLFSHLVHSAIKCELGIKDDNNDSKYELLLEVMPDFVFTNELKNALKVVKDGEGKDGVECVDPNLLSTYQFLPG
jgi:hypothetical protein